MSTRYSKEIWNACRQAEIDSRVKKKKAKKKGSRSSVFSSAHASWRMQERWKRSAEAKKSRINVEVINFKCSVVSMIMDIEAQQAAAITGALSRGRSHASSCPTLQFLAASVAARCLQAYAATKTSARNFRAHVPNSVKEIVLQHVAKMSLEYVKTTTQSKDDKVLWGPAVVPGPVTTRGLWKKPQITDAIARALFTFGRMHTIDLSSSAITRVGLQAVLTSNDMAPRDRGHAPPSEPQRARNFEPEPEPSGDDSDVLSESDNDGWEDYIDDMGSRGPDGMPSDNDVRDTWTNWVAEDSDSDYIDDGVYKQQFEMYHDIEMHPAHCLQQLVLRNCANLNGTVMRIVSRCAPGLEKLDISCCFGYCRVLCSRERDCTSVP
mgnify:FL=1